MSTAREKGYAGGARDGTVEGTNGDDLIDVNYTGDPDGDRIDADDAILPGTSGDDDLVEAGPGNDTILAGEGNDTVNAGRDDDLVYGGDGDDVLNGEEGQDILFGDGGDDTLNGESGDDTLKGGEGDDVLIGGKGDDFLGGQAGNDTMFGGVGDDTIYGNDGDDIAIGGRGDDEIHGGSGNDTIIGGEGANTLSGGDDRDLFLGGSSGDVVDGGSGGDDFDMLDLTGSDADFLTYTSDDREDGIVTFRDGSTMTFEEIENVIPCFTPGTTIATPRGERLVEELKEGDRIITRDNGIQEIRWIGRKDMNGKNLVKAPHLRPVLIRAGSLGNGLPERDMLVSPNHRVLVANDRTQLYFEEREVLAAAKHLVGTDGVHQVEAMQVSYIHFMFDRHEVVLSNGAWTESFQPGDYSLKGLGNSQRNEIFELFPELTSKAGVEGYQSARKSLKKHETRLLVK